ncbi:winged helix-turn-helix domain-containing protein [Amphibacillus cookii]|uniref:winged helix-turn-helix domain-containing protein n=1 Tax=Amphibacillus cookii TaxID=767787 RepID=UPI001958B400|nr:winged helix-turn-helix domain-containing protein [Amphibacillus cookii]MBM7542924.1 DNA-binding winged helix-turn-helix (wHTH) protein [Amphibacillus cookii]
MHLTFQLRTYTVTYKNDSFSLLKKEFELLHFLYQHDGQVFTRQALLDQVWTDDYPTDRTVDDHIYRIRKKIKKWQHHITIDTVKGYGYVLNIKDTVTLPNTLHSDEEFKYLTTQLMRKFHLYGHGEALETLLATDSFGIEKNGQIMILPYILKGDFLGLVRSKTIPFDVKLLYLLHMHLWLANNPVSSFRFLNRALNDRRFAKINKAEAETLAYVTFAIMAKKFTQAEHHIKTLKIEPDHGFYPFSKVNALVLMICLNRSDSAQKIIEDLDYFFNKRAYQRELGIFFVVKGLFFIQRKQMGEGKDYIREGMLILKQSRFVSHLIMTVDLAIFLLTHYIDDQSLRDEFNKQWVTLLSTYHLNEVHQLVTHQLEKNL